MDLKKLTNVAEVAAQIMGEGLKGDQHKIDKNKNNKVDAHDFAILRGEKKAPVKEEQEQIDELSTGALKSYIKGAKADKAASQDEKSSAAMADDHKTASDAAQTIAKRQAGIKSAKAKLNAEEAEQEETILEYESKGGVYKHKGTYGTEKSTEAGYTDYDKENELAKKHLKDKPAKKKYGARQNFVRSTRVNESFSGLMGAYKEGGLKGLFEGLMKEEPTEDEYNAEVEKAKAKSQGKDKAEVAKASVQAVKTEQTHTEVQVIDMTDADNIKKEVIDISKELEERSLTEPEMKKKEKIVKSMKKGMAGFKERYGERAKSVMYATATKQAKGE